MFLFLRGHYWIFILVTLVCAWYCATAFHYVYFILQSQTHLDLIGFICKKASMLDSKDETWTKVLILQGKECLQFLVLFMSNTWSVQAFS